MRRCGNCASVFNWRETYFTGPLTGDSLAWWGWMYYGFGNGSWINSSDGNSGDTCS